MGEAFSLCGRTGGYFPTAHNHNSCTSVVKVQNVQELQYENFERSFSS